MVTDRDLFQEEKAMVSMSFGEHIEDLRRHLILGLLGLAVGVVLAFVPPINLGWRVMRMMEEPAQRALNRFSDEQAEKRAKEAAETAKLMPPRLERVDAGGFVAELKKLAPKLALPDPSDLKPGSTIELRIARNEADMISDVHSVLERQNAVMSLAPLETMAIFFMVCLVTGLVISSPWVFYQVWAFVAAGLYRHERRYVQQYLPYSLGLFLTGVFLCFFVVLPVTLSFLLDFNIWLGVAPNLRLSEWMSFATLLPLIFGLCFQTPLVMLLLERLGIVKIEDFRSKRKYAAMIILVAAAVITPTQDPMSMMLLAAPMFLLYEVGIFMIGRRGSPARSAVAG